MPAVVESTRPEANTGTFVDQGLRPVAGDPLQARIARSLHHHVQSRTPGRQYLVPTLLAIGRTLGALPGFTSGEAVANVTQRGEDLTPLHLLAWDPCGAELAAHFLRSGADPHARGRILDGRGEERFPEPSHLAAWLGNTELLQLYLDRGVPPSTQDPQGRSLAYYASESDDASSWQGIIPILEHAGADLNAPANDGSTPLSIALRRGNWELVDFLLERHAHLRNVSGPEWQNVSRAIADQLHCLADQGQWEVLSAHLGVLHQHLDDLGIQALQDWLNIRQSPADPSLLHKICSIPGNSALACLACNCGADIHARCEMTLGQERVCSQDVTCFHLAAATHDSQLVSTLQALGADTACVDALGNNALFYALDPSLSLGNATLTQHATARTQTLKTVLEACVESARTRNQHGRTPSDLCVLSQLWQELALLTEHGGEIESLSAEELLNAQETLKSGMSLLASTRDWASIRNVLDSLARVPYFLDTGFLPEVLNDVQRMDPEGQTVFLRLIQHGAPAVLLDRSLELCADPQQTGQFAFKRRILPKAADMPGPGAGGKLALRHDEAQVFPGPSPHAHRVNGFHYALLSGCLETIEWAEQNCQSNHQRDSLGSPLAFYAAAAPTLKARTVALEFLKGRNISAWESNPQGFSLYDMLLASEDWRTVQAISDWLAAPDGHPEGAQHAYISTLPLTAAERAQRFVDFARIFAAHGSTRHVRSAYAELRATGNVDVAIALQEGMREAMEPRDDSRGKVLATLMPAILSGSVSPSFFRELADALSNNQALRLWVQRNGGYHPNLPELMALLSIRDPQRMPLDLRRAIIRGLSSAAGLRTAATPAQLEELSDLWGQLALECYSFAFYKHFTRRVGVGEGEHRVERPSIFQTLGMAPRSSQGFFRNGFGIEYEDLARQARLQARGYQTTPEFLDPKTLILARQGGILISHPSWGTLFISNVSPVTGSRDSIRFPVMYSLAGHTAGFSDEQLMDLDESALLRHFYPLLHPSLLDHRLGATKNIQNLYAQWMGFRAHICTRIFDTNRQSAWGFVGEQPVILQGAFFRPEFAHVLDYLEGHLHAGGSPLKLAFVEKGRSAWELFPYRDHLGHLHRSLEVDLNRLAILRRLHEVQPVSEAELVESDVHPFLNSAGIHTEGWLTIMD